MKVRILYFGMFQDITGQPNETIELSSNTINELEQWLITTYPQLNHLVYKIAVNQQIRRTKDYKLKEQDEIALLPQFAGG
jgi:molybdopterin converting factor small subunit